MGLNVAQVFVQIYCISEMAEQEGKEHHIIKKNSIIRNL